MQLDACEGCMFYQNATNDRTLYINDNVLDSTKLKAFADDKINDALMRIFVFNSFLTDDTRGFCGRCRSRSDCTERAV